MTRIPADLWIAAVCAVALVVLLLASCVTCSPTHGSRCVGTVVEVCEGGRWQITRDCALDVSPPASCAADDGGAWCAP